MTKARLILIHGRAQEGKSESELISEWTKPLRDALGSRETVLNDVEVVAPFFGDTLAHLTSTLGAAVPEDILVRGTAETINDDYRRFMAEAIEDILIREGISPEAISAYAGIEVTARGPQNWPWVLATLRFLDNIPGLDGDMIERCLRDVWIYLERSTVRKSINAIIEPAFDTDLPKVVIAHSLGTVVAFEMLKDQEALSIDQFVTLGSPLSLSIVKRALAPVRHPSAVRNWFNARDERDVVALYPLSPPHFVIEPQVTNHDGVRNRTSNSHGISGYLSDERTADVVHKALDALS